MEFSIDQSISHSLDEVEEALFDEKFVAATSALPRVGDCTLQNVQRTGDRIRAEVHRRFDAPLNAAVRRAIDPSKLTWVEKIDYDLARHRGRHKIVPDNYADRVTSEYRTKLAPSSAGTRRVTSGTMTVRARFIGGKVEQAIVSGLEEYAEAEARLLSQWT